MLSFSGLLSILLLSLANGQEAPFKVTTNMATNSEITTTTAGPTLAETTVSAAEETTVAAVAVETTTTTTTMSPVTYSPDITRECEESEKHYVYTPCDKADNRWKVQIPRKSNQCTIKTPPAPEIGVPCTTACPSGEYLDIKTQLCSNCPAGKYSMGDAKQVSLINGITEEFETYGMSDDPTDKLCKGASWVATPEGYLASNGSSCKSVLKYTVNLAKSGRISFFSKSREESSSFHVWVENGKFCSKQFTQSPFDSKEDLSTDMYFTLTSSWSKHELDLEKGENTVNFVATHFSSIFAMNSGDSSEYESNSENIVQIKNIVVTGFAFSLECTECEAGYHSGPGASICSPCGKDHYSKAGSGVCYPCDDNKYSGMHASECIPRKACTANDYHPYWETCDNLMTKVKYAWNEPRVCTTDGEGVKLPEAGTSRPCPPCNPGLEFNGTTCVFCPKEQYNNGAAAGCVKCPPTTAPAPGLFYKFWTAFPNPPMHLFCLARPDDGCRTKHGWTLHDSYIATSMGHSDDAELLMYISVKEFTKVESEFTVEFEIVDCPSGNCRLKIQSIDAGHVTTDIGIYEGDQQRTVKTHKRFNAEGTKYRFLFEKKFDEDKQTYHYQNAQVKIYSIEVTNVENGGTKQCETCASHSGGYCVKCVAGYYISKEQQCVKCPRKNAVKREEGIQIHFLSKRINAVCKFGTFVVIRLVCDPHKGQGEITLGDNNCHSSTCDGCNYIFSWKSRHACAKCTGSDYEIINTACLKGKKKIRYLWKENRACVGGVAKPDDVTLECYAPHCDSCHMSTICNYFKAVLMVKVFTSYSVPLRCMCFILVGNLQQHV